MRKAENKATLYLAIFVSGLSYRMRDLEELSKPCHLPFGEGLQCCVGMEFALMEVKIALIEILRKYKFMKAPNTQVTI